MNISLLISYGEIQGLLIQKVKPSVFTKGNIRLSSPCHCVVGNTSSLLHSICFRPITEAFVCRTRRKSQSLSRTWLCCFSDLTVAPALLTSLILWTDLLEPGHGIRPSLFGWHCVFRSTFTSTAFPVRRGRVGGSVGDCMSCFGI